jgi:hypothetical protein
MMCCHESNGSLSSRRRCTGFGWTVESAALMLLCVCISLFAPQILAVSHARDALRAQTLRTKNAHGHSTERTTREDAIRLLEAHVPPRHTGWECILAGDSIAIEDPWTGDIVRIPLANAAITVAHPRFGRADPASGGMRAPLTVVARRSSSAPDPGQDCIIYSTLLVPEKVTPHAWAKIDRLLVALATLGATIEQRRPPDDPTAFDE